MLQAAGVSGAAQVHGNFKVRPAGVCPSVSTAEVCEDQAQLGGCLLGEACPSAHSAEEAAAFQRWGSTLAAAGEGSGAAAASGGGGGAQRTPPDARARPALLRAAQTSAKRCPALRRGQCPLGDSCCYSHERWEAALWEHWDWGRAAGRGNGAALQAQAQALAPRPAGLRSSISSATMCFHVLSKGSCPVGMPAPAATAPKKCWSACGGALSRRALLPRPRCRWHQLLRTQQQRARCLGGRRQALVPAQQRQVGGCWRGGGSGLCRQASRCCSLPARAWNSTECFSVAACMLRALSHHSLLRAAHQIAGPFGGCCAG